MYEPTKGQILIDGRDYRDMMSIGFEHKLDAPTRTCIVFWIDCSKHCIRQPVVKESEIQEAAKMADAHEFIIKKSLGYEL